MGSEDFTPEEIKHYVQIHIYKDGDVTLYVEVHGRLFELNELSSKTRAYIKQKIMEAIEEQE